MRKLFIALFILLAIACPLSVKAAEFKNFNQGSGVLSKDEAYKNLYTFGNSITSNANISGDLAVLGGSVTINGNIEDDLFTIANNLILKGNVGKNARIAGSTVSIEDNIGSDLVTAASSLDITNNAVINGDLIASANTISINGKINGNIKVAASSLVINGAVQGDVLAKDVQTLEIGDNAVINGKLTYYSPNTAKISNKAKINGGTEYHTVAAKKVIGATIADLIYKLIASIILALILVYGFKKFTLSAISQSYSSFWANLGWGILTVFAIPIITLLLMITVVGIKIAAIIGFAYLAVLLTATIFTPVIIGSGIIRYLTKSNDYRVDWLAAVIGVIVAIIIGLIPVIGWVAIFIFFCVALGALLKLIILKLKS